MDNRQEEARITRRNIQSTLMKFTVTKLFRLKNAAIAAIVIFAFLFVGLTKANAQATCVYTIEMFDSFGDGWNGGVLTVIANGDTTTHTLLTGTQGTSSFTATDGGPLLIYYESGSLDTEVAFDIYDPDGLLIYTSGPTGFPAPATGLIFEGLATCPNCPIPNPNLVAIFDITDTSAHVNWVDVPAAEYYTVEYGPQGFPLGFGLSFDTTSSSADLFGLNPCVTYDVYISAYCGVDSTSSYIGPYSFTTTFEPAVPGDTCVYTLQLFDSFGDGWNGSFLTVEQSGNSTDYGMTTGSEITYEVSVIGNLPLNISYTAGAFQNEVSYKILDPSGNVVFEDGPFPATGLVYSTIACPTCPGPVDVWMSDVNATNANLAWQNLAGFQDAGPYVIEFGPLGFTLGTGVTDTVPGSFSSLNLFGLQEHTYYDVYIWRLCDTLSSKAFGPVSFQTLWLNDIGVTSVLAPDPELKCYLEPNDTVTIGITNFGQNPQTLFEFNYMVNGNLAGVSMPQDGLYTGVVGNDSTNVISFETTYDFSSPGTYVITAWTALEGDSDPSNDTTTYILQTALPKPLAEDFEDNAVPATWVHDGVIYAPNAHNNPTYVLADNLFSGDQEFNLTTQRIGPIEDGDSLTFDYRYTNWSAGTTATQISGDSLIVQVSTDCEESWQTIHVIDSTNHVDTNIFTHVVIDLSAFADSAITVRFIGKWAAGDYWLDLDNINILGCPPSLNLVGLVSPSVEGSATGKINLTPYFGTGPFSYVWTNEMGDTIATTQNVTGLEGGNYFVEVFDANGCTDSKAFTVETFTATEQVVIAPDILLYPNPTNGMATLDIQMSVAKAVDFRVYDISGNQLTRGTAPASVHSTNTIDLSGFSPGMYIVQVIVEDRAYHARLMLVR
ncbi:MAG: hypothetical protein CMN32_11535 [Saprospirales bacterium]|nr:hypothetical protein [Saprospirales bacterium]